jgi:LPS export ABC transporter protein LptC
LKQSWYVVVAVAGIVAVLLIFGHMFRMPESVRIAGVDNTGTPASGLGGAASASPSPSGAPLTGRNNMFEGADKKTGRKAWRLYSRSITFNGVEKRLNADNVECTFFGDKEEPVATVWSDGALMNTTNQNMQFLGPVRASSPKGETLHVKNLRYDGSRKKFFGQGDVKLTRGSSVLTGDRIIADPNLKIVTVTGNVQVELRSLATASPAAASSSPMSPAPTGLP